ncbi:tail fiber protein [Acinetobacter phage Ab65]|nr:tail fiber protein [Acinetobacter phage Ab65]
MRGNKIGGITGTTYAYGLNMVPWALYGANDDYTNVSPIPTYDDYLARIELDVDYINAKGDYTRNVASNLLLSGRTGRGRLHVITAIGEKFYSSLIARNLSNNVTIDKLISKDTKLNGAVIEGTGTNAAVIPSNIRVKELVAYKYGMTSSNIAYRTAVSNKLSKDVFIDKITIEEHGNAYAVADTANGTLGNSFAIGHIQVNDPTYSATLLINNSNTVTDPVQLNSYKTISGSVTLAVSGGVCYAQSGGMNKEFFSTPAAIVGLPVKANDYINLVNVGAGATNRFRVVTSGLYGSTAVVEKVESRASSVSLATQTLAAGASVKVRSALSLSGLLVTDKLEVNANIPLQGCFLYADITEAGMFDVYMYNPTSATVTTSAGSLYFKIL